MPREDSCNHYVGERDKAGEFHGNGTLRICDSDVDDVEDQALSTAEPGNTDENTAAVTFNSDENDQSPASTCGECGCEYAVYEGEFVHGKKHGAGKMTFPDGSFQVGTWTDGIMGGVVVYVEPDGSVLVNTFQQDGSCRGPGLELNEFGAETTRPQLGVPQCASYKSCIVLVFTQATLSLSDGL